MGGSGPTTSGTAIGSEPRGSPQSGDTALRRCSGGGGGDSPKIAIPTPLTASGCLPKQARGGRFYVGCSFVRTGTSTARGCGVGGEGEAATIGKGSRSS